jgi:O-antigen/teichoic acid export membrane protein
MRSLLSDSVVYGIGVGMLPVGLLLITPVIARRLGPVGFGTIDLLTTILTLASVVAILGMDSGLARSYFDFDRHQQRERQIVVRTALVSVVGLSVAVSIALAVGALFFAEVLETTRPSAGRIAAIVVACTLLPFSNAVLMARETLRLERRRSFYVGVTTLQAAVGVTGALVLLLMGAGPAGYFAGLILGAVAALAVCLTANLFAGRGVAVDRDHLRTMLRYGLPLVPAALATWVIFAIDRSLLAAISGMFAVGYYALASKIAAPLFLALNAFGVAWIPFILSQPSHRQRELRARALTAVACATGIGYVLILLLSPQLITILGGSAFHQSSRAVPGIALGWLGWGIAFVLTTEFMISRRTKIVGIGTIVAACVNVLLNVILIPPFGFVGAAWATAATFALLAATYFVLERRTAPAPYRWGRLVLIALAISVATLFLVDTSRSLAERVPVAVCVIAALVVIAGTDRSREPAIVSVRNG